MRNDDKLKKFTVYFGLWHIDLPKKQPKQQQSDLYARYADITHIDSRIRAGNKYSREIKHNRNIYKNSIQHV